MCEYCKVDDEGCKFTTLTEIEVGRLGYYGIDFSITNSGSTLDLTESDSEYHLISQKEIKIKYCPFCGREL